MLAQDVGNGSFANMQLQEAFATVLRRSRKDRGLTQADLALRSGLTSRYIRSLEASQACPSLDAVFKLAMALEVAAHELVTRVELEFNSAIARTETARLPINHN